MNETIRQCLVHGWGKKAEKLRADFKVPDKRWWYVKVKALTETRDWEALDQFVRSKSRSPIPLEAVVDHLIATGNPRQAIKYVPKCEGRNRPELFVKAGEWVKAGEGESGGVHPSSCMWRAEEPSAKRRSACHCCFRRMPGSWR